MSANMGKASLLEDIRECAKCNYLSDLHVREYAARVRQAAARVNVDAYPIKEWNGAIEYIVGEAADFKTAREAVKYLLQALMVRATSTKKEE